MGSTAHEVVDFSVSVLDAIDVPEFPAETVLEMLASGLGADGAVFHRVWWRTGDTSALRVHGGRPTTAATLMAASRRSRSGHPLMVAAARGRLEPTTAQRATGGDAGWRRSPLRAFLKEMGDWDHMSALWLRGGDRELCGLGFVRSGADFTAADLDLLRSVQPLLQAVERHTTRMDQWRVRTGLPGAASSAVARASDLTAREVSVLLLMGDGLTATATARRLGCSPRTVQKHAGNLYRKLDVHDRLTAVLEGQRRGLLPLA